MVAVGPRDITRCFRSCAEQAAPGGYTMKTTIVRYKLKAGKAEENRQYVSNVFAELDNKKPDGLRYVSFQLDDELSFVHIAVVESDDGKNPLAETDAFKEFVADLKDRCDEPPVATSADIVGSYRLFWQRLAECAS
jgi:hypothetical protein